MRKITPWVLVVLLLTGLSTLQAENIIYPKDLRAIVDVTQAPYYADPTGQRDCTAILIRALDDILRPDRQAMQKTIANLEGQRRDVYRADSIPFSERQRILGKNPEAVIGFERCSGIFPYQNAPGRILYFPNGTYLVSDTICYSFQDLQNGSGMEFNRNIHFQGQSEKGVVIRLQGQAEGFDRASPKPVISFMRGTRSNVSMQNTCENLTIEIGAGNPGAVGLQFFANNTGAVRHVTVRSRDADHAGHAAVAITHFNSSCVLLQHITLDGCDYGVKIGQHRLYTVLEHITLSHQRKAGFYLRDHNVAARAITSHNAVPAVRMEGRQATLALVDCEFSGDQADHVAIDLQAGFLFARNIKTQGYRAALQCRDQTVPGPRIREFVSHSCPVLFPGKTQSSLNLPVQETPEVPWEQDLSKWMSVNACGAKGDGLVDDTDAIQQAMHAGKSVVYFQPGVYLIDKPITVPAQVQRINFMYADLVAGGHLQTLAGQGAFKINEDSNKALILEDLFAFERYFGAHYLVDHACRRTVILSDLHTQVGAQYKNSVPGGKVFIENVCTTDQFAPFKNCFRFTGQQVWARQLNPERADPEVLNEGSKLWVLGFKTEKSGTGFLTTQGGHTEMLGGIFNISRAANSSPMIVSRDSHVSVFASTTDHRQRPASYSLRPFIEETRAGVTRSLNWNHFPKRDEQLMVIPLYMGRAPDENRRN